MFFVQLVTLLRASQILSIFQALFWFGLYNVQMFRGGGRGGGVCIRDFLVGSNNNNARQAGDMKHTFFWVALCEPRMVGVVGL